MQYEIQGMCLGDSVSFLDLSYRDRLAWAGDTQKKGGSEDPPVYTLEWRKRSKRSSF